MPTTDQVLTQLDRLAGFDGGRFPVISLYLDMRPNENGRHRFEPFLRKELGERLETYEADGPERDSLNQDIARIEQYVYVLDASTNGVALFSCSGAQLFEALPLSAPINEHRL